MQTHGISQRAREGQRETGGRACARCVCTVRVHGVCPEPGGSDLRQSGSRVPDSWLNLRWTLSSCRVRTSSWGTMAAELSHSRLSFLLLRIDTGRGGGEEMKDGLKGLEEPFRSCCLSADSWR